MEFGNHTRRHLQKTGLLPLHQPYPKYLLLCCVWWINSTPTEKSARHASVNQRNMISRVLKKKPTSLWSTACSPKIPQWDISVTTSANWKLLTTPNDQSMRSSLHGVHLDCSRVWYVFRQQNKRSFQTFEKQETRYKWKAFYPQPTDSFFFFSRSIGIVCHLKSPHPHLKKQ